MDIKLLELRKEKGISQEEIAKKLGVTCQAYSRYERNEHELGYEALNALADFFDVSIDYLLGHSTYFYPDQIANNMQSPEEQELLNLFRRMDETQKLRFTAFGEGILSAADGGTRKLPR